MVVGELTEQRTWSSSAADPAATSPRFGPRTSAADHARRAQPAARRRVPARGLHPVQGAAARRPPDRGGRACRRIRRQLREAADRARQAPGLEAVVVDRLCGGINTLAKKRNVRVIQGLARSRIRSRCASKAQNPTGPRGRAPAVQARHHRHRLARQAPAASWSRGLRHRLERRPEPRASAAVVARHRWRLHRLELGQVYAALGSRVTVIEVLDRS